MNENEFEHGGKVYVAKAAPTKLCFGCAFNNESGEYCESLPASCTPKMRKDGQFVIFVERQSCSQ